MRWLVAVLWVAAAAGCLGDAPEAYAGPTGQIDGAVLNHVLVPYGNVTVLLPDMGMEAKTTPLGGFSFFDVPIGHHTVEVRLEDGTDREVVLVEQDNITRVILQVFPPPAQKSYVTDLSKTSIIGLAMPGEDCEECDWRTPLRERHPDLVELIVAWNGYHPVLPLAETHLSVELRDQDGNLLAGPLGRADVVRAEEFRLCAVVPAADLPRGGSLDLLVAFDEDNEFPHPELQVESFLRLHYADVELSC